MGRSPATAEARERHPRRDAGGAAHVCDRIVALWGRPECSDYLRQLLRDNRAGERGGFTLPVVQEILLLIDLMADREAAATNHRRPV